MRGVVPYALAVAAASFICIAVADLIPGLHHRTRFTETVQQIVLIGLGVLLIYATMPPCTNSASAERRALGETS